MTLCDVHVCVHAQVWSSKLQSSCYASIQFKYNKDNNNVLNTFFLFKTTIEEERRPVLKCANGIE